MGKVGEVVVDVLVGHLFKIETAFACSKDVLDVCYRDFEIGCTYLQDLLAKS